MCSPEGIVECCIVEAGERVQVGSDSAGKEKWILRNDGDLEHHVVRSEVVGGIMDAYLAAEVKQSHC